MKPQVAEGSTESSNENVNEGDDITRKGKGKKKNRDGNFAAGLALMHGFSAANIGASRLTVSRHPGTLDVILMDYKAQALIWALPQGKGLREECHEKDGKGIEWVP